MTEVGEHVVLSHHVGDCGAEKTNITIKPVSRMTPSPPRPTKGLERLHQLDRELLPFRQLL